jgi:hypothetical protein
MINNNISLFGRKALSLERQENLKIAYPHRGRDSSPGSPDYKAGVRFTLTDVEKIIDYTL